MIGLGKCQSDVVVEVVTSGGHDAFVQPARSSWQGDVQDLRRAAQLVGLRRVQLQHAAHVHEVGGEEPDEHRRYGPALRVAANGDLEQLPDRVARSLGELPVPRGRGPHRRGRHVDEGLEEPDIVAWRHRRVPDTQDHVGASGLQPRLPHVQHRITAVAGAGLESRVGRHRQAAEVEVETQRRGDPHVDAAARHEALHRGFRGNAHRHRHALARHHAVRLGPHHHDAEGGLEQEAWEEVVVAGRGLLAFGIQSGHQQPIAGVVGLPQGDVLGGARCVHPSDELDGLVHIDLRQDLDDVSRQPEVGVLRVHHIHHAGDEREAISGLESALHKGVAKGRVENEVLSWRHDDRRHPEGQLQLSRVDVEVGRPQGGRSRIDDNSAEGGRTDNIFRLIPLVDRLNPLRGRRCAHQGSRICRQRPQRSAGLVRVRDVGQGDHIRHGLLQAHLDQDACVGLQPDVDGRHR
mmetsp:Transcript_110827/g.353159  ORF Transcript_110827/g.353159 Transcript_110827/m.353159 type:complete len:463 (+) Transcript_110827:684-2072(+)